jgi:hypothetical protein
MRTPTSSKYKLLVPLTVCGLALAGCGASGGSSSATQSTSAAQGTTQTSEAQSASAGDIPDNQQFLAYRSHRPAYSIKYPEGWARQGAPSNVTFADKDNQVHLSFAAGAPPSVASAKSALASSEAPQLKIKSATTESIAGAPVIHIAYEEQGKADPVTGKRLPLMVDRYLYAKAGQVATLDESTPVGVDNVDAYRLIAQSFRWG